MVNVAYKVQLRWDDEQETFVPEYTLPEERPTRGLDAVLKQAEAFGVPPRQAVMSRLSFLAAEQNSLKKKIWGCEQQVQRMYTDLKAGRTLEDFQVVVKGIPMVEKYQASIRDLSNLEAEAAKGELPEEKQSRKASLEQYLLETTPLVARMQGEIASLYDFRRLVKERTLAEKYASLKKSESRNQMETESLQDWMNGKKSLRPNEVSEEDKAKAHAADIRLVLDDADISYRANGMLKCPFHGDQSESASIKEGYLHCFTGCTPGVESRSKNWDAVALYRRLNDCGYYEAVRAVLRML